MPHIPKVILLLESSRASGRNLLRGIAEYARHHGPWSFFWEPRGLEAARIDLKHLDADGIILRDMEQVEEVAARGIPTVVVGHSRPEIPGLVNVITDSPVIGRMAAEHLLECGFRHFGYCGLVRSDIEMTPWSRQRGEWFSERLREAGFATQFFLSPSKPRPRARTKEREAIAHWLQSLPKPVGVMACNDDRAQHLLEACKLAGLRVPEEVGIIGADNDELVCELADPPLSSVEINFERAGYESAQALDRLMRGSAPAGMMIPVPATHIVARQSTDVLFLDDPQIVRALRFIRAHSRESVQVNDVAGAAGLSRRVLEKRFRRLLGRPVLSEIRRMRVEQICRLLVATNQPVSQIAAVLGFDDVQHVARYFHKEKGMTPLEFRKRSGRK